MFICSCFLMYSLTSKFSASTDRRWSSGWCSWSPRMGLQGQMSTRHLHPGYWPDESRQHGTSFDFLFCQCLIYCTIAPLRSSADPPSRQQEFDADVRQQKLERGKPPTAWTRRKYCKVDHTSSIQKFKNLQIAFISNSCRALLSCFGWLYAQASHLGFTPMTELTFPLATQVKVEEVVDAVTLRCCSY